MKIRGDIHVMGSSPPDRAEDVCQRCCVVLQGKTNPGDLALPHIGCDRATQSNGNAHTLNGQCKRKDEKGVGPLETLSWQLDAQPHLDCPL